MQAFAQRAEAAQAEWLRCAKSCDACCRTRRSAWAVELDYIRSHVEALGAGERLALQARQALPEVVAGERCVFLDETGACSVYEARPILCMTHGPVVLAEAERRWCGLNFADSEAAAEALSLDAVLDLDRLNLMLSLVNQRFVGAREVPERDALDAACR